LEEKMNKLGLWSAAVLVGLLLTGSTVADAVSQQRVTNQEAGLAKPVRYQCQNLELTTKGGLGKIFVRKCFRPDGPGTFSVRWFARFDLFTPGVNRIGLEARVVRPSGTTRHHSAATTFPRRSPKKGSYLLKRVNSIHFKACDVNAEGIFYNCSDLA
jgi:hypothetical protein